MTARIGDRKLVRLVSAGNGYLSQFSLEQVIGIGDAERVDELLVRWPLPGGALESFGPVEAGRRLTLIEGEGELRELPPVRRAPTPPARPGGRRRATDDGAEVDAAPAPRPTPPSIAIPFIIFATGPTLLAMWLAVRSSTSE